jgi:hypothetical protein
VELISCALLVKEFSSGEESKTFEVLEFMLESLA